MAEQSALTTLIAKGRLRQVRNLLIEQASFALVLALSGAILLLILGTQILNWYWLVLLFAVSLGAGAYRGRNKILSHYRVAQSIDAQLSLHDSLSTAYFFGEHPNPAFAPANLVEQQRERAETVARSTDLHQGIPFIVPRTLYINAALALAAFTMFGVRYGITRSMDLRASLIHVDFDGFFSSPRQVADSKKRARSPFEKDNPDGAAAEPWDTKTSDLEPQPNTPMETVEDTETSSPDGADANAKSQANGKDESPKGDDLLNSPDKKGDKSDSNSDKPGEAKDSPDGDSQSGKQDNAQQNSEKSGNSGENSSLADKMKDAISNLMAKLKTQPKDTQGKQGGSSSQPSQQSAQKQGQNQQNQKGNQGEQQSENNANSQSQGDQQSQNGAQQSAQSQSEARNSDQTAKDGKSGIGKQDGDKTAREAAQQAAMGKISEIIGKRAANISGEVMVEVSSGKQQLKTQYSQRDAKHAEAGGEINRDEVPLAYQQFIQQYFEEIRKEPAAKAKPPEAKSKASGN